MTHRGPARALWLQVGQASLLMVAERHLPLCFRIFVLRDGLMCAGLVANPVVWCSLASVKTTGGGLPAGPFGLIGECVNDFLRPRGSMRMPV